MRSLLFCNSIYFYLAICYRNISKCIHTPRQYLLVFYRCIVCVPVMAVRMWWLSGSLSKCNWPRSLQLSWDSSPRTEALFPTSCSQTTECGRNRLSVPGGHGLLWRLTLAWRLWWLCWTCLRTHGILGSLHPIFSPSLLTEVRLALQPNSFHSLIWLPPNVPSYMHSP